MWALVRRAAASLGAAALAGSFFAAYTGLAQFPNSSIPVGRVNTLDGHTLTLPADLPARATVLILGFGRHSQDATTAWEKRVRMQLAHPPAIGFYDMAMLAEVPGFVRPMVLRSVRKAVPDVLKPNFVPLTEHEDDWKRAAGYDPAQPDAAYVLLVDAHGNVRWSTHENYNDARWQALVTAARQLADHPGP